LAVGDGSDDVIELAHEIAPVDPRIVTGQQVPRRQKDVVVADVGKLEPISGPGLGFVVEGHLVHCDRPPLAVREVAASKRLGVAQQVPLDEVRYEIADQIPTDAVVDQAELFQVASLRDRLGAEVGEELAKVPVQRPRELHA
jgi:hypothetical protein